MQTSDILTPRLRLVTLTPEMIDADRSRDYRRLSALLEAELPAIWPPEHWEPHVFEFILNMYATHPQTYGWPRYLALRSTPSILVGSVGASPRGQHEAEIGYGLLPGWQGMGFATEAAQALIAELLRDPSLHTITAQTFPTLAASLRVMQKCGMQFMGPGEEPGAVRYGLHRPQALMSSA